MQPFRVFYLGEEELRVFRALVSKSGESMLGVIYDPYEEKLYIAIKGQNSLINQIPIAFIILS